MSRLGPVYCFGCGKPTGSVEYGDVPRGLIYGPCCADEQLANDAAELAAENSATLEHPL